MLSVALLAATALRAEEAPAPAADPAAVQTAGQASATLAGPASFIERMGRQSMVHGYIATDFQGGVLVNDATGKNKITPNFEQFRFIFGVQSELAEKIVFNSEVEFEHATRSGVKTSSATTDTDGNSTTSADRKEVLTSASAGLEIEIEQGWVEFRHLPQFRPRIGVVLVPLGRLNLLHDSDLVASVDRPLVDQQIIGTTWFEPGVGFTGQWETGDWLQLSYQAYAINGLRGSAASVGNESKLRDLRMHKDASNDNNGDKALVGRLALSPWPGLELAASGYRGAYDPAGSLYITYAALDGQFRWRWFELQGEWVEMATDLPEQGRVLGGQTAATDPGYFKKSDPVLTPFASLRGGWYGQLLARLPWEGIGTFEPFVQVSQIDPNKELATANDQTRMTYGLNFRPGDNVVLKLNYADTQYVQGYAEASGNRAAVLDQRLMASLAASY